MCYNLYWMKAMQGACQIQTCVFFILCVSVCACAAFLFWSRSLYYDHVLWYVLILFSRESYVAVREESKTKSRRTETERWAVCSHICPLTLTSPIHPALLTSILSSVSISLPLTLSSVCFYTSFPSSPHRPLSSLSAVTHLPPSSHPMFKPLCSCPRRSLTLPPLLSACS